MLKQYADLLANVRRDGIYHPIRPLVQPDDPWVKEVADVLIQFPDFVSTAQDFVFTFAPYQEEIGDYWRLPMETLAFQTARLELKNAGVHVDPPESDCDDLSILLGSILRNYLPPDQVFCAIGDHDVGKGGDGHMWVVTSIRGSRQRIIEATAPSISPLRGKYTVGALFNDQYAFATDVGLKEFGLIPVPEWERVVRI